MRGLKLGGIENWTAEPTYYTASASLTYSQRSSLHFKWFDKASIQQQPNQKQRNKKRNIFITTINISRVKERSGFTVDPYFDHTQANSSSVFSWATTIICLILMSLLEVCIDTKVWRDRADRWCLWWQIIPLGFPRNDNCLLCSVGSPLFSESFSTSIMFSFL